MDSGALVLSMCRQRTDMRWVKAVIRYNYIRSFLYKEHTGPHVSAPVHRGTGAATHGNQSDSSSHHSSAGWKMRAEI